MRPTTTQRERSTREDIAERASSAALVLVAVLSCAAAIIVGAILWQALSKGAAQ